MVVVSTVDDGWTHIVTVTERYVLPTVPARRRYAAVSTGGLSRVAGAH